MIKKLFDINNNIWYDNTTLVKGELLYEKY